MTIRDIGLGFLPQRMVRDRENYNANFGTKAEALIEIAAAGIYTGFNPNMEDYAMLWSGLNAFRFLGGSKILINKLGYFGNPILELFYRAVSERKKLQEDLQNIISRV